MSITTISPEPQDQIAHLRKEKTDYLTQLIDARRTITAQQQNLIALTNANRFQSNAVKVSTSIVDEMVENTKDLKSKIASLEKLNHDKNKEISHLQGSLAKEVEKVQLASKEILSLKSLLNEREALAKKLQQDHQSLESELKRLKPLYNASLDKNASLQKDNEALLEGICNFSTQADETQEELFQVHNSHDMQQQTIDQLSTELHYLKSNMYVLTPAFPQ